MRDRWKVIGVGLMGMLGLVAACSEERPSKPGAATAEAGAGGTGPFAGAAGEHAAESGQGDAGVGQAGAGNAAGAGGASGEAATAGGAGGQATTGGASGEALAGGASGNGGDSGRAGAGPGICEATTPTQLPSCSTAGSEPDGGSECQVCLQAKCCDAWQACLGDSPRNACGYGAPVGDAIGEMECINLCWNGQRDSVESDSEILEACSSSCRACTGLAIATTDLVGCAYAECSGECYPR